MVLMIEVLITAYPLPLQKKKQNGLHRHQPH